MEAFPLATSSEERVTGLSCPDFFVFLGVRLAGTQGTLTFRFRTGHLNSQEEVIIGKEKRIEEHLWAALTLLDELAAFLRELVGLKYVTIAPAAEEYEARATRAAQQQAAVRSILARN